MTAGRAAQPELGDRMQTTRRLILGGGLGALAVGRDADISVFSVDLMSAPFADIAKAHAVMTIVGGKVVYQAAP